MPKDIFDKLKESEEELKKSKEDLDKRKDEANKRQEELKENRNRSNKCEKNSKKSSNKLKTMWVRQSDCTKVLIILIFMAFLYVVIMFLKGKNNVSESDLVIRSIMVSIIGYFLGSKVVVKYSSEKISVFIAGFISIVSMSILIISEFIGIDPGTEYAVAIRDALASCVGFLISNSTKSIEEDKKEHKKDQKQEDRKEDNK